MADDTKNRPQSITVLPTQAASKAAQPAPVNTAQATQAAPKAAAVKKAVNPPKAAPKKSANASSASISAPKK